MIYFGSFHKAPSGSTCSTLLVLNCCPEGSQILVECLRSLWVPVCCPLLACVPPLSSCDVLRVLSCVRRCVVSVRESVFTVKCEQKMPPCFDPPPPPTSSTKALYYYSAGTT